MKTLVRLILTSPLKQKKVGTVCPIRSHFVGQTSDPLGATLEFVPHFPLDTNNAAPSQLSLDTLLHPSSLHGLPEQTAEQLDSSYQSRRHYFSPKKLC